MASFATKKINASADDGIDNNANDIASSRGSSNLKSETLMKFTHMAWMRQQSECSIGYSSLENIKSQRNGREAVERKSEFGQWHSFPEKNVSDTNVYQQKRCAYADETRKLVRTSTSDETVYQSKSSTSVIEEIHVPIIPYEEFDKGENERDSNSETSEGDALDRNLIVERRRNLVKSISKLFFRTINPNCRSFDKFCFVDGLELRRTFDKVFSHHRRVTKKTDRQSRTLYPEYAATTTSNSLNAQAPPFWPQTKNVSSKELDNVYNDAKIDPHGTTPTSFAPTTVLPSAISRVDSVVLGSQSTKTGFHKRGYILNRRPLSENCAQISNSQSANLLDFQSQRQEYLRATLDQLDALRLNNFSYFQCDDVSTSTSFTEAYEMDCINSVSITEPTSSMSNAFDSLSKNNPRGPTSAANLNITARPEHAPTLSTTCVSYGSVSSVTSVVTACSLINSSCQSKPIVAPCSTFCTEMNPQVLLMSELASGATVTSPNENICQSRFQLNQTRQFNRDNSESKDHFTSPLQRGVHDKSTASFDLDSNSYSTNYEAHSKLTNNAVSPPPSRTSNNSRSATYESQTKQVFLSGRKEIVLRSTPNLDYRGGPKYKNYYTSTVGTGPNYLMQCNGNDDLKSTQFLPQKSIDATLSDPLQPAFATGLRAISSCSVSEQPISRHSSVNNDIQFQRFPGTPAVDQNPRILEQHAAANTSCIVAILPDHVQNNLSNVRIARISDQPSLKSLPLITIPESNTRIISDYSSLLPQSTISDQCDNDRTINASVYRAPSQPTISSPVTPGQYSSIPSFFSTAHNALAAHNPDLTQHLFVKNADMKSIANKPLIQSSQNTLGVCHLNVSSISESSPAPHHRDIFNNKSTVENNNSSKLVTPISSSISHSSPSAQYPSHELLPNSCLSDGKFDNQQHSHGKSIATIQHPGPDSLVLSQPNIPAFIPSQHSAVVISGSNEIFAAAYENLNEKRHSPAIGEKSVDMSRRSSIETGRHLPSPTSASVYLPKRCELYPSSGSNLASSPCVATANEERITFQQSGGHLAANCSNHRVTMSSAPTARGFDFPTTFSYNQLDDGDGDAFYSVGPHWTNTNVKDSNSSKRDPATVVGQSSG